VEVNWKQNSSRGGSGSVHSSTTFLSLPSRLQSLEISPCSPLFLEALFSFAACASWVATGITTSPAIFTTAKATKISPTLYLCYFLPINLKKIGNSYPFR
jgi:hypothetical protein